MIAKSIACRECLEKGIHVVPVQSSKGYCVRLNGIKRCFPYGFSSSGCCVIRKCSHASKQQQDMHYWVKTKRRSECVITDPETRNFVRDLRNIEIIMQNTWILNVISEYQLGRHRIITLHTI